MTNPKLESTIQILQQLNPSNQDLIISLAEQLAEREGIRVAHAGTMGLATPMDGIPLWETMLVQEQYSPRTIELYLNCVKHYLRHDPMPTSLSIRTYLAERLKQVSTARVANERKALRNLFNFLFAEGLWMSNPVDGVKSITVRYRGRECPEPETVMAILKAKPAHKGHTPKFQMMTVLLVGTALRITEAASIERRDINFDKQEIRVMGKGAKERIVPIDPLVTSMLKTYMEANPTPSVYLFPGEDCPYTHDNSGGYWNIRSYEKTLARICKRQGFPHTTPHQLRHFYATYALEHGAKLEVISKILGHASVAITADIYRHVKAQEMHREHEMFSPFSQMQRQLTAGKKEEK